MSEQEDSSGPSFRSSRDETEALQRSLALLNNVAEGIFQLDTEGRFIAINDSITDITGYTRDDLRGEHVSVLLEEADVTRLEREIRTQHDASGGPNTGNVPDTPFNLTIETASGNPVRCELRINLPADDGTTGGIVGVVRTVEAHDQTNDPLPSVWETHEAISSVIDEADVGVFVLDEAFDVVWINETIEEYFGVDRTEIVGRDKATLIQETIRDRFADSETFVETALATYEDNTYVEQFECQILAADNREERWLEHRSRPIESGHYAGGRVELYYDISDRKTAERVSQERKERLRQEHNLTEQILETVPVGIAVVNRDGSVARANERMTDLLEFPPNSKSYTTDQQEMYDENGEFLPVEERPVPRVFETGEPVIDQEIRLTKPDGQRQWLSVNARPIADEQGDPKRVLETATDITDLKELSKRRKRALDEREKELAAMQLATDLLESRAEPVDQFIDEFVTILPQFFKHPEQTDARVSIDDVVATTGTGGDEQIADRITAHTSTINGTPIAISVVHQEAETTEKSITRTEGFLQEEQELIETLALLLKLHLDRQEYIDGLQRSNKRLEQFAYAASHDLQEPLRMVSSYLQLIEQRYADKLDADGEEFLEYAVDGAERMRAMIDGLLQYSRVESRGEPFEAVDLDDVLADVLNDLRLSIDEHDANITSDLLPTVKGDASQLRQVFQNLIDNALEYSGDDPPRVHVTAERTGDRWQVTVSDEGIGIDPEDADRVFEVFQRLHTRDEHAGTGIGLALCRRIIERHGGEIQVESEPGEGTAFSFTLPVLEDEECDG
ncbi:sensor box histidine kinase (plasmid) [Natrialba magadii ATCC 43099]|uniref:histidine kinase n=1 Tax=Natrialba magadii (strain ATCC 43099 / DSM 3394 / CCM 3739 / CIP 104546 / IAM 13178 / JCM 8861 / NBRC 102185 / NCIMB 2190 / MS3) TaxID=547559 RepID=D3T1N5_NATMM|nr:ATP-binding protein [Natrialba magadii]ADD07494.1 sensor box histidine kinase [Natrialba magadii ATCC 43099]ELY32211.1 PAS/PAC sensor signal transduction histidine kinase [Natrialba magadii ATCC 43099]